MKKSAMWLYQLLTNGYRARLQRNLRQNGQMPIAVLFYHRIADQHPNGWTMPRKDFVRQLDWLEENFDVVSLHEAQRRIRAKTNTRPTVTITFDDGYAENAQFAIPELAKRNLPATYFVATDFIESGSPFPHDIAAGQPLQPNSVDELREFASCGIEIGAHTRSHCDLGKLHDRETLASEIMGSVRKIRGWLDRPVRYFAFPYGLPANTTQIAVDVLAESGLSGFCTAYGAWNWPDTSGFHLRRIHADPGFVKFRNWLTLDPRKLKDRQQLPFNEPDYPDAAIASPEHHEALREQDELLKVP